MGERHKDELLKISVESLKDGEENVAHSLCSCVTVFKTCIIQHHMILGEDFWHATFLRVKTLPMKLLNHNLAVNGALLIGSTVRMSAASVSGVSLVYLNQVCFNQTAMQLNTMGDLTQVVPESPPCKSDWQKATGCATRLSLQQKGGLR